MERIKKYAISPPHTHINGKQYYRHICKVCYSTKKNWALNAYKRNYWYQSRYSITTNQYEELLKKQDGVCAICGKPPRNRRLHIDHDHKCCPQKSKSCGKCIRGLLCRSCNYGLSWFQDNSERLLKASHYLKQNGGV